MTKVLRPEYSPQYSGLFLKTELAKGQRGIILILFILAYSTAHMH